MGKRYSKEEITQIESLVKEGYTDKEIAEKLERTQDGIRNIRHRMNLRSETEKSIQLLKQDRKSLFTVSLTFAMRACAFRFCCYVPLLLLGFLGGVLLQDTAELQQPHLTCNVYL